MVKLVQGLCGARKETQREENIKRNDEKERITVSAETLAGMLDCGRATAVKIGTDAGAKIQIGRRTLYKVSIVEKYLDNLQVKNNEP